MKCEKCGCEVKEGTKFCGKCGNEIIPASQVFCKECGVELNSGVKFCQKCGAKVVDPSLIIKTDTNTSIPIDTEVNNVSLSNPDTPKPGMSKKEMIRIIVAGAALVTVMFFVAITVAVVASKTSPKTDSTITYGMNSDDEVANVTTEMITEMPTEMAAGTTTTEATTTVAKIPVVDVTNMEYEDAVNVLLNAGFTNITSDVDSSANNCRWLVVSQSIAAGEEILAEDNIELKCVKKCYLYLDITSESNLFFNTYSISVSLDGNPIGTVDNGSVITYMADIDCGEHTIEFVKKDSSSPKQSKILYVNENTTFSCKLIHSDSSIDINNESIEHNLDKASIEVIDVTNISCFAARQKLKNIGFANITTNPENISPEYNWIVTSQSVAPGTQIDKNDLIQLTCISGNDYFAYYVGKNANECEKLAEGAWYRIVFKKDAFTTYDLSLLSEKGKEDYIVSSVSYSGFNDQVELYLTYIGPTPVPTATPTPRPTTSTTRTTTTTTASSVYYSTNDSVTVKNGDSGVYAYSNYKPGNNAEYVIYLIIDFDEGYIYYFCEGNGDEICDRLEIDSGNLNEMVFFYYVYDDYVELYAVNFAWKRQPDHLILQDEYGNDWDYYPTDLNEALELRDSKEIYDYF